MAKEKGQIKFWIEAGTASAFKARCAAEGVSMASVVSRWMSAGRQENAAAVKVDTRPERREAVGRMILQLEEILDRGAAYRDGIPEAFG